MLFLRRSPGFSTSSGAMCIRISLLSALSLLGLALASGCGKSNSDGARGNSGQRVVSANEPVATIHWLGAQQLAAQPSAAGFLKIWRLPETERLKDQILDKLALAPWHGGTNLPTTVTNFGPLVRANASASLLRPLLDDLVQQECYLEIRGSSPSLCQLGLAVRLDPKHQAAWENNLASLCETATGSKKVARPTAGTAIGWTISAAGGSPPALLKHVDLVRAGEWMLVGLAPDQNPVFTNLLARVQRNQPPWPAALAGDLLQTTFDLQRLASAFSWGWDLPQEWPQITLAVKGDGQNLQTSGQLHFSKPLSFQLETWNIPTNLIHEPVHSFTAIQGIKPWLSSIKWWQNLHAPSTPNQVFFWAQSGLPFVDYAAAPLPNAAGTMAKIGPGIMDSLNPLLSSNRMGQWERANNFDGVNWVRAPIISPFVRASRFNQNDFLFGGLTSLVVTSTPPPAVTIKALLSQPNTVYFAREVTGPRLEAWMYVSQLFRVIFRSQQLPAEANFVTWLRAIGPLLGTTSTLITKSSPSELTLTRSSTVGLSAIELQFMADWVESPRFPYGFYSEIEKLPPLPAHKSKVNGPLPKSP